ncbi:hypothetical protein OSB04_026552 [Centaurea solstitialis]|uniref:Reverse transcriptase zinc-binding domain-containing protein n=1 Tax=Centaurea solstitialis TaxID=347529 RepID=A0AA38SQC0_9ASTR|nr:hypothetical protein OSB04_026552 [Centaurea solstitialis]
MVGANMSLVKNWKPILDKINSKLSTWKEKNLSFGGRVTLCKLVLGSVPLYFLSLFKAPLKVVDEIEKIRRRFIWGSSNDGKSKICWVNWQSTNIAPKKFGGLGIGSIKTANLFLVIKAIHGVSGRDASSLANSRKSGVWLNIAKAGESLSSINLDLDDLFTRKVGDGNDIFFWSDRWLSDVPLKCMFPDLFELEVNKNCTIAMRFSHRDGDGITWNWAWSDDSLIGRLSSQIHQLEDILKHVELVPVEDGWRWEGDPTGEFMLCPLCEAVDESVDHLFYSCLVVKEIWKWLASWCKIELGQYTSLDLAIAGFLEGVNSKKQLRFLEAAIGSMFWSIWKARNNLVFNNQHFLVAAVVTEVQANLYTWAKYRGKRKDLAWQLWCCNPISLL